MSVAQPHEDLRVIVSHHLKITAHCCEVTAKRFRTLWALRWVFTKLDTTMFSKAYATLARTKFENCVQAAIPCLEIGSDILNMHREQLLVQFQNYGAYHTKSGLRS